MMTKQDPWFLEERVFAFASLLLTNRHDAIVRARAGSDMAVDLLVEILKNGASTLRFLGVQIVEYMDLPTIEDADEGVRSRLSEHPLEAKVPVCVFVIGVRKPEGIYRWVVEPVIDGGRAVLRRDTNGTWQPLDEAGAARLLDQVNAWYDALNGGPAPKARGRHARAEG
jgi:hypothetical protein